MISTSKTSKSTDIRIETVQAKYFNILWHPNRAGKTKNTTNENQGPEHGLRRGLLSAWLATTWLTITCTEVLSTKLGNKSRVLAFLSFAIRRSNTRSRSVCWIGVVPRSDVDECVGLFVSLRSLFYTCLFCCVVCVCFCFQHHYQSLCTIFSEGATTKPTKRQRPIHINGCERSSSIADAKAQTSAKNSH